MFDEHIEYLIKAGIDDTSYQYTETYGFQELSIDTEYDDKTHDIIATSVLAVISENNERLIFRVENLNIQPIEDRLNRIFYHGKAICIDNDNKYGIIDKFGNIVVKPYYDFIETPALGNYLVAHLDGKTGVIDFNGNVKMPFVYDSIMSEMQEDLSYSFVQEYGFILGYFTICFNGKYGVIDENLETIFECEYKNIHSLESNRYNQKYNSYFILENHQSKYSLYHIQSDNQTQFVWDKVYTSRFSFYIPFRKKNRFGFYDLRNQKEILLNFSFDLDAFLVSEKKYIQIKDKQIGKYAVFDTQFNQLTDFIFIIPVNLDFREQVILPISFSLHDSTRISTTDFFRIYGLEEKKK